MGSVLQYLHPSLWGDLLHASVNDLGRAAFWAAVLQIIFINMLLSGDNAVVIAMACRDLPQRQRFWGLVIGAGAAVLLRLVFTGVVGQLMLLPYLKLIGGLALVYVAAKLLVPERADKNKVVAVAQLWRAVRIVVVADIVMSLDNVIAVAAIAQGSLVLLAIGLVASIPIIVAGAALIMVMLERFPIFIWAGAALLGWVAGDVDRHRSGGVRPHVGGAWRNVCPASRICRGRRRSAAGDRRRRAVATAVSVQGARGVGRRRSGRQLGFAIRRADCDIVHSSLTRPRNRTGCAQDHRHDV